MHRSVVTVTLVSLLVTAAPALAAGGLAAGGTRLVGSAASGSFSELPVPVESAFRGPDSVSGTGRFVAFSTSSTGLAGDADDRVESVYVKDRVTGTIALVSRRDGAAGAPNDADCSDPAISDDGARVVFVCTGPLVDADTNGKPDVYLRDRDAGTTTLVSRTSTAINDASSSDPAISGDGKFAAFASSGTIFFHFVFPSVGNRIYRRTLGSTTVSLVDPAAGTLDAPNGTSGSPSISADGGRVAFVSDATNLVAGITDANGKSDVYRRDLDAGTTTLVSAKGSDATTSANGYASDPEVDDDGNRVAFDTTATDVVAGDTDATEDVVRRDLSNTTYALVDVSTSGAKATNGASLGGIDGAGKIVSFAAKSTAAFGEAPAGTDTQAYRRDLGAGTTTLVSRTAGGALGGSFSQPGLSTDGKVVAVDGRGLTPDADPKADQVFARENGATTLVSRPAGTDPYLNHGGSADLASQSRLSADGRYALFSAAGAGLSSTPFGVGQLWRRDNRTGAVVLVSRGPGADGPPAGGDEPVYQGSISDDGNRVAFTAVGNDFGLGAPTDQIAVYVRDIAAGTTVLASRATGADGAPAQGFGPDISGDGRRVAFSSQSLAPDTSDLYVRDLAAGVTTTMPDTPDQPHRDQFLSLNADGTRLAWSTRFPDPNEENYFVAGHAYVADVGAAAAKRLDTGAADSDAPSATSISGDGARVAFETRAALIASDTNGSEDVYVADVASGAFAVASAGHDGAPGDEYSYDPQLSRDGHHVAFLSSSQNLGAARAARVVQSSLAEGYERDLASGALALVSRADGATGAALSRTNARAVAVDADGGCVAFQTDDDGLAPGLDPDLTRVWLRAVTPACLPDPVAVGPTPTATATAGPTVTAIAKSRPKVTRFKGKPRRFRRHGKKRGTRLSFTLDQAASVRIVVARLSKKHPAKRIASLTFSGLAGPNGIRFRRRHLKPGRYRFTLTATSDGGTSKPVRLTLRAKR